MSRRIHIFDTTLRDGNKLPFVVLNLQDRLAIAHQLSRLGVDAIDAGYPAASPEDREAVIQIAREVRGTRISALCRAIERDVSETVQLLREAEKPYVQIFLPISARFLHDVLGKDGRQVLMDVQSAVRTAASALAGGAGAVQFSLGEVAGADPELMLDTLRAAVESGATVVNVADTNGTLFPAEAGALVGRIREALSSHPDIPVGVHFHNDLGLATASTLAAVEAGAGHVEVTVGGIGSRAGNASLEEVVYGLEFLSHRLGVSHPIHLDQLYATARLVDRITGLRPHPNKPVIGRCAFQKSPDSQARQALPGWAQDLLQENSIGRPDDISLGQEEISPDGFRQQLNALGLPAEGVDLGKVYQLYRSRLRQGRDITAADLESMIQDARLEAPAPYALLSFNVMTGSATRPVGVVELVHGGKNTVQAAPGNGPVDALCRAVDRAVGISPRLILYSVDALLEAGGLPEGGTKSPEGGPAPEGGRLPGRTASRYFTDARAEVTVTLSFRGRRYHGHAGSTDIVGASLHAYLDAVNRIVAAGTDEPGPGFYVEGDYLWE